MDKKRGVDDVGGLEIMTELFKMYGPKRGAELVGWAVVWGVSGAVKDMKALREDLEARGLSQATAYKAAADFRRLGERLEDKEHRPFTLPEIIQRLKVM
jgi:hypothetical protein